MNIEESAQPEAGSGMSQLGHEREVVARWGMDRRELARGWMG
jgi:hypothetical protein